MHNTALSDITVPDAENAVFRDHIFAIALNQFTNQKLKTMLDKIFKNNKIMAMVSIATLAIVAYVLVYKPWKEKKELEAA